MLIFRRQQETGRPEHNAEPPRMVQGLGNASPMPEIPTQAASQSQPQKQETGRRGREGEGQTAEARAEVRALEREAFAALHSVGLLPPKAHTAKPEARATVGHAPERDGMKSAAGGVADAGLQVAGKALETLGGIFEGLLGGGPPAVPPTKQEKQIQEGRAEAHADERAAALAKAQEKVTRMMQRAQEREQEEERRQGQGRSLRLRRERD
jgi:hypothetical protein